MLYRLLHDIAPLRAAVRFIRGRLERYRLQVWRLEGRERASGVPLAIIFAGQLENKNYVANLAFSDFPVEQALGRRWLWTLLPPRIKRDSDGVDLRIVESYENQRCWLKTRFQFFVPVWIGSELDLNKAVARLRRSKNAKSDLQKMRKNETTYEVTRNRDAFEHFYSNMYLPYIKNRYGNRAFSMEHEDMVGKLGCAELFLVKVRGEQVAGQILLYEERGVRAWSLGVKDGDSSHVKAGAVKALNYLTQQYVAERGYKFLHMGGSRSFLLDGVLKHKKLLGARLSDHTRRYFSLSLTAGSVGAGAFVTSNPFIHENKGTYWGTFFTESDFPPSQEQLRERYGDYLIDGLAGLSLFNVRAGHVKQFSQVFGGIP